GDRGDYSQAELLSYLVTGKPSFELGGSQAAFIQNVGASFVAGELERTVVSDLGVPLDYFEIRPGEASNPFSGAQIAAGWAIGTKVVRLRGSAAPRCEGSECPAAARP